MTNLNCGSLSWVAVKRRGRRQGFGLAGTKHHCGDREAAVLPTRLRLPASSHPPLTSVADPDPNSDPHVFGPPGSGSGSISQRYGSGRILLSWSINSKKILDLYCFVTYFWFFTFEKRCKIPSKSNMQINFFFKLVFCWHLEGQWHCR